MRSRILFMTALLVGAPLVAHAQFYSYPSFQTPRPSLRDFNFGFSVAGNAGTSLVFQWRERAGKYSHFQLDAGLADPKPAGSDARLILGGSFAYQPTDQSSDFPLDLLLTGGIGGSFGDGVSLLRIPVGLSAGHRFVLDAPFAITPYVHPRVVIGHCSVCGRGGDGDTQLGIDIDLGMGFEVTRSLEIRASATFAGSHSFGRDDSFGVGLVWKPLPVR